MSEDLRERARWLSRNVLPHEALVRAKLRGMCGYDLDIEDVIQEMYTRILSVPSLEAIRYPRQYALKTAKAIIIDYVRHSHVVSITTSGSLETLEVSVPEASSEERLEFQAEIRAVAGALAQLPKTCRETLILRRIEGLSQREVAKRLSISENMVEKYMVRGVRQLIKIFGRGGKSRANTSATMEETRAEDAVNQFGDR
ncbi:MAG TPA: sigma-70 family RNA polymerase sigma factor [Rhizomicrobium sp.]|nr:sigma-70 family RNA polymerase sigma factor [Rhizomicrobium sp.]